MQRIGNNSEVDTIGTTAYGIIITPTGKIVLGSKSYYLKTVWMQENNSGNIKFVTAYPQIV